MNFGHYSDVPVVGDWDGDGDETVGVWRPPTGGGQAGTFFLRNSNTPGQPDLTISYGGLGDEPAVGDWDGDGDATIGVFRPATGPGQQSRWLLRNSNTGGVPQIDFLYGGYQEVHVRGDWDGDGDTTIGIFRPAPAAGLGAGWLLRNSLTPGPPSVEFSYGGAIQD